MSYNTLKALVNSKVYENTEQRITGGDMNDVLQSAIASLGAHYQMGGLVSPTDQITVRDEPVVFIATTPGTYTYFGSQVVADGEVALLVWSGTAWSKKTPDIATRTEVSQLGQDVESGDFLPFTKVLERYIDPQGIIRNSAIAFYTTPIFIQQGEIITYSITGVACAILSSYANNAITPIVIAGDTPEVYTDATYTAPADMFIMFCGDARELFKVSSNQKTFDKIYGEIVSLKDRTSANEDNITTLNEDVDNIESGEFVPYGIVDERYIKPDGTIGNSAFGFYTTPIFVKQGEVLTYSIKGTLCSILSSYSNGIYTPIVVTQGSSENTYTDVTFTAQQDMFVAFSGKPGTLVLSSSEGTFDKIFKGILKNETNLSALKAEVETGSYAPITKVLEKYIDPQGEILPSAIAFYTNPIYIRQGEIITYSITGVACAILSSYDNGVFTPIVVAGNVTEVFTDETYTAPKNMFISFCGDKRELFKVSSNKGAFDKIYNYIADADNEAYNLSMLRYGSVNSNGAISPANNSLLLSIKGGKGFYLKLNDGYIIAGSHLFDDATDKMLEYNFCGGTSDWIPIKYDGKTSYGQNTLINGQHLLVVIKKNNNGVINNSELQSVIRTFCYLEDSRLHRWIPSGNWFLYAHKRMRSIANLQWDAQEYVKPVTSTFNANRFLKGQRYNGVPYSDASEKMKYIGVNVSPYTFQSAAANKRSVVYTEDIHPDSRVSKYNIDYNSQGNGACHCFYGSVCSGFTAAIMGLPLVYMVSSYAGGSYPVPNLTTIANAGANDVQPFDLIYHTGHISIISDIYKDDYGRVKYIIWAEFNYPNVWINVYTPEVFEARLADTSAIIRRYSDWANTCTDIIIPDCVPAGFNDYVRNTQFEKDLHVFTGDKSCFSLEDPIYLNINRTPGYTTLLVYKDDAESPTFSIDISGLEQDTLYPEDTDDWCIYNMRLQTLTYGKYKARLSDGNGNYSGYIYFEVIDSEASINIENGVITSIEFTASNATPIAVMTCDQNYYQKAVKIPTSSEIENKVITLNWSKNSALYLNLLLRGDYGVVYKRFALSSL